MGLVYVTGASGVGKSAVCGELRGRGFVAYDIDADELARWFENGSGVEVELPALRDDAWFANNTYRLPRETVERVATEVGDGVGFICGTVGNDNEIWDLFETVISLSLDAKTLRRRLTERAGGFGSSGEELERVLGWHARVDADNSQYGAVLIDASPALAEVVDRVLGCVRGG
ncbi:AAA family ATPase [Kribbella sp. NPDC006257]|uniref:AAA family ATPase n=1 Tax=Kribbella sp. NPDC006257 TaxID=3156738 RepID=UPI0033A64333